MKIDDKKAKTYYFRTKVDSDEAKTLASRDASEMFGVSSESLKVSKPRLKYDFYCIYEAEMEMTFLRVRKQEIGVNDEVKGVLVGKEVMNPKKGREIPGKAIKLELVEMFEIERSDSMILDGSTGAPARSLEPLLTGPGKKGASSSWIAKAKISSGKYNSIEKVVRQVAKAAAKAPKDAKKVTDHTLSFRKLRGLYVPTYYIRIKHGDDSKTMRVNAVDGSVSLRV
jgi:hypothetical protein